MIEAVLSVINDIDILLRNLIIQLTFIRTD